MPRTALLIVDLFSRFDFPDGPQLAPLAFKAAKKARQIRDAFDEKQWPVIYANDNFGDWQRDFPQLVRDCRHNGGSSAEVVKHIGPGAGHYFVLKPKHSAFLATPLAILLAKLKVNQLVLCGMALDSCVLATALDANSREYRTVVARQAVAALPDRRKAALQVLEHSGAAKVLDTPELIKECLG